MRDRSDAATLGTERLAGLGGGEWEALGGAARRSARRTARKWALYALARPALYAGEILPRSASAAIYANASLALCSLTPRLRRRALRSVQCAFPEMDLLSARRLVIESFRAMGRSASDVPRLRRMSREALLDLVSIRGLPNLEAAIARGRGVVGIAPHLGNWEVLAAALTTRGIPLTAVAAELYDPRLGRYLVSARERWGVGTIVKGAPRAAPEAIAVLQRGEMLGTLIDLHTRDDGITVPFLGRASHMASGPIRLALRAGAAVVPMAIVRARDGRYVADI